MREITMQYICRKWGYIVQSVFFFCSNCVQIKQNVAHIRTATAGKNCYTGVCFHLVVKYLHTQYIQSSMQYFLSPSYNMFRPQMAIIGCFAYAKTVTLYKMFNYIHTYKCPFPSGNNIQTETNDNTEKELTNRSNTQTPSCNSRNIIWTSAQCP
jgi:hypothetical protein